MDLVQISFDSLLSNGIIFIDYIKSKGNIADPLTKGLSGDQVNFSSRGMSLKPVILVFRLATQPSWLEIPRYRFKGTIESWMTSSVTVEITFPTHCYDEIVIHAKWRISYAFNDSYMSVKWATSMRFLRLNSLEYAWNLSLFKANMNTIMRTNYVRKGIVWIILSWYAQKA